MVGITFKKKSAHIVFLETYSTYNDYEKTNELEVPLESLIIYCIHKYCTTKFIDLRFVSVNKCVDSGPPPVTLFDENIKFVEANDIPWQVASCICPVVYSDVFIVTGLCSVARHICLYKNCPIIAQEHSDGILGFRQSCLQAPNEVSIWTKFCEIDLIKTAKEILTTVEIKGMPRNLIRFEYHMKKPVRIHNVYKVAQEQQAKENLKAKRIQSKDSKEQVKNNDLKVQIKDEDLNVQVQAEDSKKEDPDSKAEVKADDSKKQDQNSKVEVKGEDSQKLEQVSKVEVKGEDSKQQDQDCKVEVKDEDSKKQDQDSNVVVKDEDSKKQDQDSMVEVKGEDSKKQDQDSKVELKGEDSKKQDQDSKVEVKGEDSKKQDEDCKIEVKGEDSKKQDQDSNVVVKDENSKKQDQDSMVEVKGEDSKVEVKDEDSKKQSIEKHKHKEPLDSPRAPKTRKWKSKKKESVINCSTKIEDLNISHEFAEGPFLTLADLVILPSYHIIIQSFGEQIFGSLLPFTYKWYKNITSIPRIQIYLGCMSKCNFKIKPTVDITLPATKDVSLYKCDPKRHNPKKRLFTKEEDIEKALASITEGMELQVCSNDFEPSLNWDEIPEDANPYGHLPDGRVARKTQQLENMAVAVMNIAKDGDLIVDFCCGSGHLGILLAHLLPNCKIILLENKAQSLNKAQQRVQRMRFKNVYFYLCNVDFFIGKFDIGIGLHACGIASDLILDKCLKVNAKFILSPCCYGSLHPTDRMAYPRSAKFSSVPIEQYMCIGHTADQTHIEHPLTVRGARCMAIIDSDRGRLAEQFGYKVTLSRLKPLTCTPKNNLLIGIPA